MSEKEPRIIDDIDELLKNLHSLPDDVTEIWAQDPSIEPPEDPDALKIQKPQLPTEVEESTDKKSTSQDRTIYLYNDFMRDYQRATTTPLVRGLGERIRQTAGEIFHAKSHLRQTHGD